MSCAVIWRPTASRSSLTAHLQATASCVSCASDLPLCRASRSRSELESNSITAISSATFKGLVNLHYLDLTDNHISLVPAGVFEPCMYITYLGLGLNRITLVETSTLATLASLGNLFAVGAGIGDDTLHRDVQGNQLTFLSPDHFASMQNLSLMYAYSGIIWRLMISAATCRVTRSLTWHFLRRCRATFCRTSLRAATN